MELTMAAQEDDSPWEPPPQPAIPQEAPNSDQSLPGRAFFSQLGVVRRKPARGDAPPTLSKSCSDKLALKECTSLLSALTALLISPTNMYLDSIVLPQSQYSAKGCARAFSPQGRMMSLDGKSWLGGYSFVPFRVETTTTEFHYSKKMVTARSDKISASNLAAAWTSYGLEESLIGGVIQGRKAS